MLQRRVLLSATPVVRPVSARAAGGAARPLLASSLRGYAQHTAPRVGASSWRTRDPLLATAAVLAGAGAAFEMRRRLSRPAFALQTSNPSPPPSPLPSPLRSLLCCAS
jgi:hypothetical protein